MRYSGNLYPDLSYPAPRARFGRTLRIALIAAAIGATTSVTVLGSLIGSQTSNVDKRSSATHAPAIISMQAPTPPATALPNAIADQKPPPAIAPPAPSADSSVSIAAAPSAPAISTTEPAKTAPDDAVPAEQNSIRAHRRHVPGSSVASTSAKTHVLHKREVARSFQHQRRSMFVQLNEPCCMWMPPPVRYGPPNW